MSTSRRSNPNPAHAVAGDRSTLIAMQAAERRRTGRFDLSIGWRNSFSDRGASIRRLTRAPAFAVLAARRVVIRVDEQRPLLVLRRAREREREHILGAVQHEEEIVVDDRIPLRVEVADPVPGEEQPEAGGDRVVPVVVRHPFAVVAIPLDVVNVGAANPPIAKELRAMKRGMRLPNRDQLLREREERGSAVGSSRSPSSPPRKPEISRCPGNRRCCCLTGCGRSRRRRRSSESPCETRGESPAYFAVAARGASVDLGIFGRALRRRNSRSCCRQRRRGCFSPFASLCLSVVADEIGAAKSRRAR